MRKFSALIMITPLVLASIGMPTAADACEILETRMTRSSLFVNEDASKWEIAASASGTTSDALNVAKCKGGYLQVSLGATLPHPQSYAGLMFTGADFQRAPVCTITDDSSSATSRGSIAFGETVRKFQSLARNCVGITVEEPSGQPVDLVSSVACEVASKNANSSVVTLKGDNCLFKPSKAGMRIYPAILKSCQNELAATDLRELDLTLNLQFAMDLKGETSPDGLAAKPIHVVFSAKKSPHVVRPSSSPKSNTAFKVSSQYAARVSLAQFSLRGSTETGLLADANYLIERSENDPAGNYRLPLVVKNELYLVQAGNSSQHIGTWFNGSIVPAGWTGQDGQATFNRLFESQMPGKLSAIAKAIRAGDQLVLVSKFENPNLAPVQFANYLRRQAAKQKRALPPTILPENAKTVSELPKLDTLGLIEEISALPTLAGLGERHIQRIKDLMTWPVRYSRVCLNSHCANPDRLTEGLEIQTVFRVESADFEVTLKQERQLEKWNGQVQPNPKANLNQRIECI